MLFFYHFINQKIKKEDFIRVSYLFKIKQKQNINVYFQEPSSICESEFIAYKFLYTGHLQSLLGFLMAWFS